MIKHHYQVRKAIWIVKGEALALIDVCYIKWRVTGKQHIQAYFTPQSVKDVSCSILCTVVMAKEDSNIWSDGVPRMAGDAHWVRVLCKKISWYAYYLGGLWPIYSMNRSQRAPSSHSFMWTLQHTCKNLILGRTKEQQNHDGSKTGWKEPLKQADANKK